VTQVKKLMVKLEKVEDGIVFESKEFTYTFNEDNFPWELLSPVYIRVLEKYNYFMVLELGNKEIKICSNF